MPQPNFKPNTIFCRDNLLILQKMNSECVDLIYADPPFNKKKKFSAPIGSSAEGAEFKDYFVMSDVKEQWIYQLQEENAQLFNLLHGIRGMSRNAYNYAYLIYMGMRIIECHRVLKPEGAMYLHCDHTMAHYLKLVLDMIFGEKNFRNEIAWCYRSPGRAVSHFPRKHDTILFYAKSAKAKFYANADEVRIPYAEATTFRVNPGGKFGARMGDAETKQRKTKGKVVESWWTDIEPIIRCPQERTGYPTQKPLKLLRRIIAASSNKGDLILDPFCGCATACVAAQMLERQWVGIDVSELAWKLVQERMKKEVPNELQDNSPTFRVDLPKPAHTHPHLRKHIYVIGSASFPGQYKVGYASDPKRRLASYQTSSPKRDYELVFSVESEFYEECEQHIHQQFNADYEWVTADADDIIAAMKAFLKQQQG